MSKGQAARVNSTGTFSHCVIYPSLFWFRSDNIDLLHQDLGDDLGDEDFFQAEQVL